MGLTRHITSQFCGTNAYSMTAIDGVWVFCSVLCPGVGREKISLSTGPCYRGDVSERGPLRSESCCGSEC